MTINVIATGKEFSMILKSIENISMVMASLSFSSFAYARRSGVTLLSTDAAAFTDKVVLSTVVGTAIIFFVLIVLKHFRLATLIPMISGAALLAIDRVDFGFVGPVFVPMIAFGFLKLILAQFNKRRSKN